MDGFELLGILVAAWFVIGVLVLPAGLILLLLRLRRVERRLRLLEGAPARTAGSAPAPAVAATTAGPATTHAPARAEAPAATAAPAAAEGASPPRRRRRGLEEAFAARWMVWLGGLTVALAAVFLFRYAVEQGWLGPAMRVGLGLALGAGLVAAGEWAHRHPLGGGDGADPVGPALTAAGVFAVYVSLYAAHGLFGLLGPAAAFAALAAASLAALALAARQGRFVALLGIAGGYLVPALVASDDPQALPVFLFVSVLTAASLVLIRVRPWPFLTLGCLAGAFGWPLAWLAGPFVPADQGVLSAHALAVTAAFALLGRARAAAPAAAATPRAAALGWTAGPGLALAGTALAGAFLVLLARACAFNGPAFVVLGLHAALAGLLGLRRAAFEAMALVAALAVAAALLVWPVPPRLLPGDDLAFQGIETFHPGYGPFAMPAGFAAFARALAGFALLFGLGGFLALPRARRPALWAGLSAGMPLFLFALGYWRIGGLAPDLRWAVLAAGLAALFLLAAARVRAAMGLEAGPTPLGLYAAGVTAALAFACACLLREGWLTVALALQVLALGWIWSRLPVPMLRWVAALAVATVLVRLVLNPQVLAYSGGLPPWIGWVLYVYGLPAAALLAAAPRFGDPARDPLAAASAAAGLGLGVLAVALQLRLWTAGALDAPGYPLFDQAVQAAWWLAAAAMLLSPAATGRLPLARWGGLALLGLAAAQTVLLTALRDNPLLVPHPVGSWPILNLLGLAYLLPAVLFGLIAARHGAALGAAAAALLRVLAGALAFLWVTLELRRAFQGSDIALGLHPVPGLPGAVRDGAPSDLELYAYSAVWIVFALALLAAGIVMRTAVWRHLALAVLLAAVAKAFLYDMSGLTGLYRVASFLGLGLALIGIGRLYRRFVFTGPRGPA